MSRAIPKSAIRRRMPILCVDGDPNIPSSGVDRFIGPVVFDIETEPFSNRFKKAKRIEDKLRFAPKPRLACAYIVARKRYQFFSGTAIRDILPLLEAASEVITFNGEMFDFLVLERFCDLKQNSPFRARCVDMWEVLSNDRFWVSLDRASRLNLGRSKEIKGKILATAGLETLKKGCRSDVKQTYLLYQLWENQKLMFPERPQKTLPSHCPECDRKGRLVAFQPDFTDMTEGQIFDYEIGQTSGYQNQKLGLSSANCGYARCTKCGKCITWGI